MMHDLFTRGVDENGHLRPPYEQAPELYKERAIDWIPKEWEVQGITDCCSEVFLGLTSKVDYVEDGGIPLVRATDITGGKLSFKNALFISERQHKLLTKYRRARKGDILVSKSGSLGVCALVDTDREFSIYESIIVLQPNPISIYSVFLLWLMRHGATQTRLLGETVGSTVGHLNLNDFRALEIPLPPLEEQSLISKCLESLNSEIEVQVEYLEKNRRLKTGLMQDLLTGKVRVNTPATPTAA
jgi:type I restriction enzyme S subunit